MSKSWLVVSAVLIMIFSVSVPQAVCAERAPGEARERVEDTKGGTNLDMAKATCTADCGALPIVTVRCPGSCVAVDRSCPIRGYAKCAGEAAVYCEEPCTCFAETYCPEGGSVYCYGTGDECLGGDPLCFVQCNDQIEFCPGHEGELECVPGGDPW